MRVAVHYHASLAEADETVRLALAAGAQEAWTVAADLRDPAAITQTRRRGRRAPRRARRARELGGRDEADAVRHGYAGGVGRHHGDQLSPRFSARRRRRDTWPATARSSTSPISPRSRRGPSTSRIASQRRESIEMTRDARAQSSRPAMRVNAVVAWAVSCRTMDGGRRGESHPHHAIARLGAPEDVTSACRHLSARVGLRHRRRGHRRRRPALR